MATQLPQNQFISNSAASPPAVERAKDFWERCDSTGGPDVCWPWLRGRDSSGYGVFYFRGKNRSAHRVSYELTHGPIPQREGYHGTVVMHVCDNRRCINPQHLRLGSQGDNNADRDAKLRFCHGEQHRSATFNEAQVHEIRRRADLGHSMRGIASEFGCHPSSIVSIKNRDNWGWLGELS